MGLLLLILINIFCPFVALIIVLCFLFSPRRKVLKTLFGELNERFAIKKKDFSGPCIWFHGASVGEIKSIVNIASSLKEHCKLPVLVTTLTKAGQRAAQKIDVFDCVLLAPVDFYFSVKRFLKFYTPKILIIVEADLWPNMIYASEREGVKVGIINGRLSQRSAKRYKLLKPLINLLIPKISFICAQNKEIAKRYLSLGADKKQIFTCGNIKYDALTENPNRLEEVQELINKLSWQGSKIVVCGSTHNLEEEIIISAAKKLENVKFIIAPRHLERVNQIKQNLEKTKLKFTFLSSGKFPEDTQILIADTMGLLGALYKAGTVAFVGGSLIKKGGHNFLEPAILKKPVFFGKYYYNTPDVAAKLLESGGGILVNKANFIKELNKYLQNNELLNKSASAAFETAKSFQGATEKSLEVINLWTKTQNQ